MSPEDNDQADAIVAQHIDALIAGAAGLEGLSDKVHARLPLGDSDAIGEAVTAMARAMDGGWRVPLDPAIKALLQSSDEGDGDWDLLKVLPGPVGIVRGAYSSFLSRAMAARMAVAVPMPAALETIEQAGHAIALEQPAALARTLARLVAGFVHGRCDSRATLAQAAVVDDSPGSQSLELPTALRSCLPATVVMACGHIRDWQGALFAVEEAAVTAAVGSRRAAFRAGRARARAALAQLGSTALG